MKKVVVLLSLVATFVACSGGANSVDVKSDSTRVSDTLKVDSVVVDSTVVVDVVK